MYIAHNFAAFAISSAGWSTRPDSIRGASDILDIREMDGARLSSVDKFGFNVLSSPPRVKLLVAVYSSRGWVLLASGRAFVKISLMAGLAIDEAKLSGSRAN